MQALAGALAMVKSEVLEGEEAQTALQQRWYEIKSLISRFSPCLHVRVQEDAAYSSCLRWALRVKFSAPTNKR